MRGSRHSLQASCLLLTHLPLWPTGLAILRNNLRCMSLRYLARPLPRLISAFATILLSETQPHSLDIFSIIDANGSWPAYYLGPITARENINHS